MADLLQNKNFATRFQILVEIAGSRRGVRQSSIAAKLGITPQAVSDYIRQMLDEGMVEALGRSVYRVTPKGVDWMLKMSSDLHEYLDVVARAVTNITVCAAVAETDLKKGQEVGLKMKDGLLYASAGPGAGAKGLAVSGVKAGEDVDISNIQGLVELTRAKITILQVPSIQKGGSRQTDLKRLKTACRGVGQAGAIGIEAIVAMRRAGIEPNYLYGVIEAAVEAARCGLPFCIATTETEVSRLIHRLQEEQLEYKLVDLTRK